MTGVIRRLLGRYSLERRSPDPLGIVREASDVIHHRSCLACRALGPPLCAPCSAALLQVHRHALGCWVAGRYDGSLRSAILAYKRRGWLALDRPLGSMLAVAVAEHLTDATQGMAPRHIRLVPVPSHRDSLRERGVDAVHRLATQAAVALGSHGMSASVAPLLILAREYPRSSAGSAGARRSVAGAFAGVRVREPTSVRGTWVIVVDDVITTGATAGEALRALAEVGIEASGAVAIAGTELLKGRTGSFASQANGGLPRSLRALADDGQALLDAGHHRLHSG